MLTSIIGSRRTKSKSDIQAKAFCKCWSKRNPVSLKLHNTCCCCCTCGEEIDACEWKWENTQQSSRSWVLFSKNSTQITFHPFYSSGTAAVRGERPLELNHHYYWEVKMLSETYGTDIMVGVGTNKVNMDEALFQFTSFLGRDGESYGLSYSGAVRHDAAVARDTAGFCRGTVVGVRLDLWRGTLEFYLNRKPQGISFYNLRRHKCLYPMVCSTAAQSAMRLIYASSWQASLLVDAAKILASSVNEGRKPKLPPGLWYAMKSHFWLTLPSEGCVEEEPEETQAEAVSVAPSVSLSSGMKRRHWQIVARPPCVAADSPDDAT